jgi:hypothetical protein
VEGGVQRPPALEHHNAIRTTAGSNLGMFGAQMLIVEDQPKQYELSRGFVHR